ncbi:MAG: hypothetical protein ACTHOG_06510 [Marmoricola sp.]
MPFCPNGHEVDGTVAFCRQCGASMTPYDAPTLVDAPPVDVRTEAPLVEMLPADGAPAPVVARPSNTAVYVLAAVLVVIGLVGIGLALVLGSSNSSGRPTPTSHATPGAGVSPTGASDGSSPTAAALPAGGTRCPGSVGSGGAFGTIGSETSCGFVQAVYQSFVDAGGLNEAQGQQVKVTATSPATHQAYDNIVCTVGASWVTCVGGNADSARMFFTHP